MFSIVYCIQLYVEGKYPLEPPTKQSGPLALYYLELVTTAVFALLANSIMTICNANEQPATVAVICYCGIVYGILVDTLLFDVWFTGW